MDANSADLRVFTRVARLGSFAAAARELRTSTTSVSRRVAAVEESFGVRLLNRTTRSLSLTPAGTVALERTEQWLADLDELGDVLGGDDTPRGHIRVTAGVSLGHALLYQSLPCFSRKHPDVSIEVIYADRPVDLVAERIDLALRIGNLADSDLVARRLGTVGHTVCASPKLLCAHGPVSPAGLNANSRECPPLIVDTNQPRAWKLSGPEGDSVNVPAKGRFAVNNADAALGACKAGLGVAMLLDFLAAPAIENGDLVNALPGWRGSDLGLYAVVLKRRWASAAVRALVTHVERSVKGTCGVAPVVT